MRNIARAFDDSGYIAVVDQNEQSGDGHARLLALAPLLVPTAVISTTPLPDEVVERLRGMGVQRLVSMLPDAGELADWMGLAAREQVRHLHDRGHGRIAYWGTDEPRLARLNEARRQAAEEACAALGITYTEPGSGMDLDTIRRALTRPDAPTAVAAYNDEIAFAVLAGAHRSGLRVPEDLAVIGVDDLPLCAYAIPALTTVSYGPAALPSPSRIVRLVEQAGARGSLAEGPLELDVVVRESA